MRWHYRLALGIAGMILGCDVYPGVLGTCDDLGGSYRWSVISLREAIGSCRVSRDVGFSGRVEGFPALTIMYVSACLCSHLSL